MVVIPLQNLPEYEFEVTLEDVPYLFAVKWNTRASQYTLDIATRDGTVLCGGIALLLDSELLLNHAGKGLPPGSMVLIDPSGGRQDVAFDDLEERCSLIYLTEAEYAAL